MLSGFEDNGISRNERGDGHSARDGEGKVPRRDDDGDATGLVEVVVLLSHDLLGEAWRGDPSNLRRIVVAEIDRFGDIGVRFSPRLSNLANDKSGKETLSLTHNRGHAIQGLCAILG